MPWYQVPPLDFVSENLTLMRIRDNRTVTYDLAPQIIVPTEQLLDRANQLRQETTQFPVSPTPTLPVGQPTVVAPTIITPAPAPAPVGTPVGPPVFTPGPPTSQNGRPIYELGNKTGNCGWGCWDNGYALAHIYRDGNWDNVTNGVVWAAGARAIPPSFYLTSKPAFFGNSPWPWVEPTAATAAGRVMTLPAKARYDAGVPNGSLTPPMAPTNLRISR